MILLDSVLSTPSGSQRITYDVCSEDFYIINIDIMYFPVQGSNSQVVINIVELGRNYDFLYKFYRDVNLILTVFYRSYKNKYKEWNMSS